jgi:16S rRNA (adenine1518-N6/adenine1519-N6)-dimethyltransferase
VHHRARKSFGQNFLIDPNIQRRIIDAVAARPDDHVLEIGPGLGALTNNLAGTVRQLSAVELDRDLAARLRSTFAGRADVTIHEADILDTPFENLTAQPDRLIVVGNIPYNITTPIIFHLLRRNARPDRIILMVQREVADRITASPGTPQYGALSVGVRTVATAERLFNVARGCFRPVPNVDSAVLRITPLRPPPLTPAQEADTRSLTTAAFGWRRKQLQKTLRSSAPYVLEPAAIQQLEAATGIELHRRPETLSPDEFIALSRALRLLGRPTGD